MTDREPYVGRPLKRTEDPRLITGRGQYVEDITLAGLAHLAFLRSPHAHARVKALRTDVARKAPGVVRVATARDLGSLRPLPFMATIPGLKHALCPYLAGDVVDATGVPVAAIVAETAALARDAAELVEVDYEPLSPIADPERGLQPGAPLAHTELGTNQAFSWPLKGGDVDGAFDRAAHVVKVRLDHNRLAGAPMEPRGVLARYERRHGRADALADDAEPVPVARGPGGRPGFPGAQAARDRSRRRRRLRGEGAALSRGDRRRGARAGSRSSDSLDVHAHRGLAHDHPGTRRGHGGGRRRERRRRAPGP